MTGYMPLGSGARPYPEAPQGPILSVFGPYGPIMGAPGALSYGLVGLDLSCAH